MAKVTTLTNDNVSEEMMSVLRSLSLDDNMSGQVVKVKMPINETVEIPHNLKVVPRYRIILRMEGAAVLVNGNKEWTDKAIYLKAVGVPTGVTNPALTLPGNTLGPVIEAFLPANISSLEYEATEVEATIIIMRN